MQPQWLTILSTKGKSIGQFGYHTTFYIISKTNFKTMKQIRKSMNTRKEMPTLLLSLTKKSIYFIIVWVHNNATTFQTNIVANIPSHVFSRFANSFISNNNNFVNTFIIHQMSNIWQLMRTKAILPKNYSHIILFLFFYIHQHRLVLDIIKVVIIKLLHVVFADSITEPTADFLNVLLLRFTIIMVNA